MNIAKRINSPKASLISESQLAIAHNRLTSFLHPTPLQFNERLSHLLGCSIFLKREDMQPVRSFKVRGALNKLLSLDSIQKRNGVVCASAGNHAQGVAYACKELGVQGVIYLPEGTPSQKIEQVRYLGGGAVQIKVVGKSFSQCCSAALAFASEHNHVFVHPFDDEKVIAGQATIAFEMIQQAPQPMDYVFVPVGGGGLAAGIATTLKSNWPQCRIVGVEIEGSLAMKSSLTRGKRVQLSSCDRFAEGTAVEQVGQLPFGVCRKLLDDVLVVSKADVCNAMKLLFNDFGIVAEASGAFPIAALLSSNGAFVQGKRVACILSGGNSDIANIPQVLLFAGQKKPA